MRWFHSGGIFASLSETTAELIIEGMQAAKAHGAVVSFDLNYREKLWSAAGGADRAVSVLGRIVEHVDVLVGNEEDLQKGLGIAGPKVAAKSKLDPSALRRHDGARRRALPEHESGGDDAARGALDEPSRVGAPWRGSAARPTSSPTCELDVFDRVGGGDGFASGFFYGLLSGESPEQAVRLGWAHGALLTTFPGDTTMATLDQVRAFAKGGSARIQR